MAKANEPKMKKLRYPIHVGDPVYLMMKLIRLVRNQATGILAADGMGYTFPQTAILVKLRETAGMSAAELARVAMVRPQTINKILVKLYADGLIEAKDDPAHGRIRRHTGDFQQAVNLGSPVFRRSNGVDIHGFTDDLLDGHAWIESSQWILENHLHLPAVLVHRAAAQPGQVLPFEQDRTAGGVI